MIKFDSIIDWFKQINTQYHIGEKRRYLIVIKKKNCSSLYWHWHDISSLGCQSFWIICHLIMILIEKNCLWCAKKKSKYSMINEFWLIFSGRWSNWNKFCTFFFWIWRSTTLTISKWDNCSSSIMKINLLFKFFSFYFK